MGSIDNNENLKLCYTYGRNSTDFQLDSRFQQDQEIEHFAQKNGFTIVGRYYDDGYSGTTIERPEFKSLWNDLKQNSIKYLIVYSSDRLSRDIEHSLRFFKHLDSIGCELISITQPNFSEDSVENRLNKNIQLSFSQFQIDTTRRLVRRAMYSLASRGLFTGGTAPYGFKIVDQKYVINEEEAPAIRTIFEMVAKNESYKSISETLTQQGFRLRSGKTFSNKTIYKDFITNQKYKGTYIYGECERSSDGKRFNRHKKKPLSEAVVCPNMIPAIVSEELWNEANKVLARRRQRAGMARSKIPYLLSCKVFCSCGKSMHGNTRLDGTKKYECTTYRCSSQKKESGCKEIQRDMLEQYVLRNLSYFLNDEIAIKIICFALDYTYKKYYNNGETHLKNAQKRLIKIDKVLNNFTTALGNEDSTSSMTTIIERIKNLEEDKLNILEEIKELESHEDVTVGFSEDEVRKLLHNLFMDTVGETDRRRLAGIIDKFIESVIVDKEKVQINYDLDFVFSGLNKYIRMSVVVLRTELKKEIKTLWYELADIRKDEIRLTYKIKRVKEKRQLIFNDGIYHEVVSL